MIQENLFDLTRDQEKTSKMVYNGKIVKCLIAPSHNYTKLERMLTYTPTTYLFPERDMNMSQLRGFISNISKSDKTEEIRIITVSQYVITDMVDDCVRILKSDNEIVSCPIKTFAANIHNIRYDILDNESYQSSGEEKPESTQNINDLISKINDGADTPVSVDKYELMTKQVDMIGEQLIRTRLKEMIHNVKISKEDLGDIIEKEIDIAMTIGVSTDEIQSFMNRVKKLDNKNTQRKLLKKVSKLLEISISKLK